VNQGPSTQLRLSLFGAPHVARADGTAITFRSRKHLALLVYLALEQRHSSSRDTLLALLWPEADEEAARNNLRVALADLRRALGEGSFLQTTRHTVQFDPASDHTLDVLAFQELFDASRAHSHESLETCAACLARLEQAVALYRGDFLHGFNLPDSSAFEEWALVVREQLHQAALEALSTLAAACERQGDHGAQCRHARRQIELEPWREQAHAQLMRGLWASGQRGAALEQYHTCQRILEIELGLSPSPELTALYQQIRTEASSEVRVTHAELLPLELNTQHSALVTQTLHNLPPPPTSFVGREAELAEIREALGNARLVTLTGAGGSGKTRLALQVAAAALPAYADGVWLVELASLQDPTLVPQAVATSLGLTLAATVGQSASAQLGVALGSKQLLLLLDNCEHLAQACRELAERLLHTCPQVTILATSREILHVAGEVVYPVPPLATPDITLIDPEQLIAYESIRLFVERARAVRPGFALTTRNALAVLQICQRLDSIPLAIELAAARVRHMAVEAIVAHLDDRFSLLTAGSHSSSRQQTLRSAIDWSYALLTEPERVCFRRLGVFAGSFTLPFAEAVVDPLAGPRQSQASLIELLAQLIDKSLLVAEQRDDGMRYRLLDSMRAYAQEKLAAAGEAAATQDRHLACLVRLAEQAEPYLFSADQIAWLDTLATEHNNKPAAESGDRRSVGGRRLPGRTREYRRGRRAGSQWRAARGAPATHG
jgi:predicted ATPase/DNA-binding SARP family transcriptional activator